MKARAISILETTARAILVCLWLTLVTSSASATTSPLARSLYDLAMTMHGANTLPKGHVQRAVNDVERAVMHGDVLPLSRNSVEARLRTARLLIVWSFFESAWWLNAIGDDGKSFGRMQVTVGEIQSRGLTTADMITNGRLNYQVAIEVIRRGIAKCGTVRGSLGMFAGTQCGHAQALVRRRCRLARAC